MLPSAAPCNQPLGEGGKQAGGRAGDFRKSLSSLAFAGCPIMTLETSTCPQRRNWLLSRSPPRHRPLAHFLLFLSPTSTPAAPCGFTAKLPISGSSRWNFVTASFPPFTLGITLTPKRSDSSSWFPGIICESRSVRVVLKRAGSLFFFLLMNNIQVC